jgi:acetyl esterase/lipase
MRLLARRGFLAASLALLLAAPGLLAADAANFKRAEDVIYGRKSGVALTMDVFQPERANGLGVVFVVSGGWFSSKEMIVPAFYDALLKRGYSVFAVVHGSQPKFQIPEIIQDMQRAVRFIRFNAARYGIDPDRIGVCGMSAGGHLSLILATQGSPGDAEAKDPVERQSSAVQCVACFFPPTDFLNYGTAGSNALAAGILAPFKAAFGPIPSDPQEARKYGEAISPIYSLTTNLPPTLILHGDADKLVPIQQALSFRDKAAALGDTVKVIVKEGRGHGWPDFQPDMESCADWFDRCLRTKKGG